MAVLVAKALKTIARTLQVQQCAVFELDPQGKSIKLTTGVGWQEEPAGSLTFDLSSEVHPDFRNTESRPVVSDVAAWPPSRLRFLLVQQGITSVVSMPVMANNSHLGILGLFSTATCELAPEDVHVIQTVANVIGLAIEGRRLEHALRNRVDQLALADRRKDEFLAMLAHELRNPLAPILSAMEFLKLNESPTEEMRLACEIIERQISQMKRLIDDLLDVARITQGKISLRNEIFDAAAVAVRAIEISRPLINARQHHLTLSLPSDPQWVAGDPTRIEQVLANLLNNAAKYSGSGSQLLLAVERHDNRVQLKVRDSGVGIPREMLAHIFDLFTQIDRSLDRAEGGLGIGLTLVRRIVELHQGTVHAFSEGAGKGSEFVVSLPAIAHPDESRAKSMIARPTRTMCGRTTFWSSTITRTRHRCYPCCSKHSDTVCKSPPPVPRPSKPLAEKNHRS